MKMKMLLARAGVLAALAGAAGSAMAFADDDARRAILDLREQVRALESRLTGTEELLKNTQTTFGARIESLQDQNRMLTGQVEELNNALKLERRSNRSLYDNLNNRMGKVEPSEVTLNGEKVIVQPQEKAAYEAAVALLRSGDYTMAADAFRRFTQDWPRSAYGAEAVYWRGSALFALERYKDTINVQNALIRTYPKHARVPDAMISVASAQASLGNVKAASSTLNKVIKQYPDTEAAKTAAQRLKALK